MKKNNKLPKGTHIFNVDEAEKYGVSKAIILDTVRRWVNYKKRNKQGIHKVNGVKYYFAYISSRGLSEELSYLGKTTIARNLLELEKDGVLLSGLFNKIKWDKTKHYTIPLEFQTDEEISAFDGENADTDDLKRDTEEMKRDNNTSQSDSQSDTQLLPKGKGKVPFPPSFGSPLINQCIDLLKEQIGGSLDDSVRDNRRFCHLLINRLKKDYPDKQPLDLIKALIIYGLKDKWHGQHITNFKYLYYNAAKIILAVKEKETGGVIKTY